MTHDEHGHRGEAEPRVIVFESAGRFAAAERALVLQSQGIGVDLVTVASGYALAVDAADAEQAFDEIAKYVDENRDYVVRAPLTEPDYLPAMPALLAYILTLWAVAFAAEFQLFGIDWYRAGRVVSGQILDGEWYRLATALTLHGDLQHIAANLGFGLATGFVAARYLGYGLATLAILGTGILGNGINTVVRGAGHASIGASTAVFAALGLIGVYAWRLRLYPQQRWVYRLGPLIGAVALLAYTGTGDENTDVGAHFWGFVAGALAGDLLARFRTRLATGPTAQIAYLLVAAGLLTACWAIALLVAAA